MEANGSPNTTMITQHFKVQYLAQERLWAGELGIEQPEQWSVQKPSEAHNSVLAGWTFLLENTS